MEAQQSAITKPAALDAAPAKVIAQVIANTTTGRTIPMDIALKRLRDQLALSH